MGLALVDREVVAESPIAVDGSAQHGGLNSQSQSSYLHQQSPNQGCSLAALLESPSNAQLRNSGGNILLADGLQGNVLQGNLNVEMETDYNDLRQGGRADDDDKASCFTEETRMTTDTTAGEWGSVSGLEGVQLSALHSVATKGVVWTHPVSKAQTVFTLHHGGDVDSDGNCLFTAVSRILGLTANRGAQDIRQAVGRRFLKDYHSGILAKESIDQAIKHLYSPDLKSGWGILMVQEVKLLARKADREALDSAIEDLKICGMCREAAAECVYKERCTSIVDGPSWADFMAVSGNEDDEHDIITLHYTEEGLLSLDENKHGRAAAFGDDIAIECIAAEYVREVFVMQAHGIDGMVDTNSCLFFLPHSPRGGAVVSDSPIFLFMKGTGWCGGGADHYEPIIAKPRESSQDGEKPVVFL